MTLSPRAAVCSTSWRPSFTMSPSPWSVNTSASGRIRFDAGGHRRRAPVQRLHEVDVDRAAEPRVAADPERPDRALRDPELLDRLEQDPHRQRLAAAGAEVVLPGEQQVGLEVGDLLGARRAARSCRARVRRDPACRRAHEASSATSLHPRSFTGRGGKLGAGTAPVQREDAVAHVSTSSRRPTPKPEPSVEMPPMRTTGARRARQAHVVDHLPGDSSNDGDGPSRPARRAPPRRRERPQRDRPHEADPHALGAQLRTA